MKLLMSIFEFLIFNWTKSYKTNFSVTDFISKLKTVEKRGKNIEGEISDSSFELFYISDFALKFPTKMPLIEVKGKLEKKDGYNQLKIKTTLQGYVKFILIISVTIIFILFSLDKYTDSEFGNFAESDFALNSPLIIYGILMTIFLIESVSCKEYFKRLIKKY